LASVVCIDPGLQTAIVEDRIYVRRRIVRIRTPGRLQLLFGDSDRS